MKNKLFLTSIVILIIIAISSKPLISEIDITGLNGKWTFDELVSPSNDSSVLENHGTWVGNVSPSDSTSIRNQTGNSGSVELDGASHIDMGHIPEIGSLRNIFTITTWFKANDVSQSWSPIAGMDTTTSKNGWTIGLEDDYPRFRTHSVEIYLAKNISITEGVWYFMATVMDSNNDVSFYVYGDDNSFQTQKVVGSSLSEVDTNDNFVVGKEGNKYFNGSVDDVRVYSRELSPLETRELAGSDLSNTLVAHYKFDNATGDLIEDNSIYDQDGFLGSQPPTRSLETPLNNITNLGSLSFNAAAGNYAEISVAELPTEEISVSTWVNLTALPTSGEATILMSTDGTGNSEFKLSIDTAGHLRHYFNSQAGTSVNQTIPVGEWVQITVTRKLAVVNTYINALRETNSTDASILNFNGSALIIGAEATSGSSENLANFFDGQIDDIRIFKRILTATEVNNIVTTGVPGELSAHWKFDGGKGVPAYDSTLNKKHGFVNKKNKWVKYLRDSLSTEVPPTNIVNHGSLELNSSTAASVKVERPELPTGDFSYATWLYRTSSNNTHTIFADFGKASDLSEKIVIAIESNKVKVSLNNGAIFRGTPKVIEKRWHHIAVTRLGDTVTIYVNGEVDKTFTHSPVNIFEKGNEFNIGSSKGGLAPSTSAFVHKGYIDDSRIYNRALSLEEIRNVKNVGHANLISHWNFDESSGFTAMDSSGYIRDGSINGAALHSSQIAPNFIAGSYSLELNGTDAYVSVANPALPTEDFSYSVWVNPDVIGSNQSIFMSASSSTGDSEELHIGIAADGKAFINLKGTTIVSSITALTAGIWSNIVATRSGDIVTLYVNGAADGVATYGETLSFDAGNILLIGANSNEGFSGNLANFFDGKIDDSRLYSAALDAEEISENYSFTTVLFSDEIDSDKDGLSNAHEWQLGTDPNNTDTDGDGLTDGDEVDIYGSDPLLTDSDGDGVSDYDEVTFFYSNPSADDITGFTAITTKSGSDISSSLGDWLVSGNSIYSTERRGYVEYEFNYAQAGAHNLSVNFSQLILDTNRNDYPLVFYVDGNYVGKITKTFESPITSSEVSISLPYLPAGSHTIRIYWDNIYYDTFLQIDQVVLRSIEGPDSNQNGIPDWWDYRKSALMNVTTANTSKVSPACVEGVGRYLEYMSASIGTVQRTGRNRWYTDVPLSASSDTNMDVSWQNNAKQITHSISWEQTNVISDPDMKIRKNDSLLLNMLPSGANGGSGSITINGVTHNVDLNTPHQELFATAGTYQIDGTFTDDLSVVHTGSMTIEVIEISVPTNTPQMQKGRIRQFDWEHSVDVVLVAEGMFLEDQSPFGNDYYYLKRDGVVYEDLNIVARIGSTGLVLASLDTHCYNFQSVPENFVVVTGTFPDGSQSIMSEVIAINLPDTVEFYASIHATGYTFEDGTTADHYFTVEDFGDLGILQSTLIKDPSASGSICHSYNLEQDSVTVN